MMAFNSINTNRENDDDEGQAARASKRQRLNDRIGASGPSPTALPHGEYTVGWICALPKEMTAATAMLDSIHQNLPRAENDINTYTLGGIAEHNVVIACLPSGYYGNNNAATVASNMRRTFPCVRLCLMVGIGGGAPGKADVRLGDVVVGEGVLQYDLGKTISEDCFIRTSNINKPPLEWLTAVAKLRATHALATSQIPSILSEMLERYPAMVHYSCRSSLQDRLFDSTYNHVESQDGPTENCELCDTSRLVQRPPRDNLNPMIHYGMIASGNQVMKHGKTRDGLTRELNALCFEMEGSGMMDGFAGLVIRGICDYSDSHKNKQWQEEAAAIAAAYAKELLLVIPSVRSKPMPTAALPSADKDADRREKLLNSLKFNRIDARRLHIKRNYTTTCEWLLMHPKYLDWLNPATAAQHRGLLWLRGGPGTGKSTIMNFAYNDSTKKKQKTTISFFFNARGEISERSIHGMYRSLLYQLLQALPDLLRVFDEPEHKTALHQLYTAILGQQQPTWQVRVLQDLLRSALARLGPNALTIFVDALDEWPIDQVEELMECFEDIGKEASLNHVRLNICFSSRYYPHIQIQHGYQINLEDQDGHEKDIAMFIQNKLKLGVGKAADEVKTGVQAKAKGIFMWVVLVVNILKAEYSGGRLFNVKKRLASLPAELSDLFKEILLRDQMNLADLRLCIQWILFAERPLKLEEYYFAAVSVLSPEDLQEWDPDEVTRDAMGRFVVSSSKGLAEITETTNSEVQTVQFIHESVREFFLKDGLQKLWPDLTAAEFESASNGHLQQCCYTYFKFGVASGIISFWQQLPTLVKETKQLRDVVGSKLPFLQYATRNIFHHANAAANAISQQEFLTNFILKEWILIDNIFEICEIRRHTPNASLLYILAEKNYAKLIKYALCVNPITDIKGERHQYPLFAALANGNQDAANALFRTETGHLQDEIFAELNCDWDFQVGTGQTPLSWAAANGLKVVVRFFLEQGSNIDARDEYSWSPLIHAAKNGHTTTVQLLLDKGAHMATPRYVWEAILHAAKHGHTDIVQLLLDSGVDLMATSKFGLGALLHACSVGDEILVSQILGMGADIMTKDKHGKTPLGTAAEGGHEAIARLLIENGADITAKDNYGQTPLVAATKGGHTAIVQLLIKKGANIIAEGLYGLMPPLMVAARWGHEAIVRLLIENGADVMGKNVDGQIPLIAAAGGGHEAIMRLLIEHGADVMAKGLCGLTPLMVAARGGHEAIVRLLIENGADVMAKDYDGQTPLIAAAGGGHEAIVRLLIENGADVMAKNVWGQAPLIAATRGEHEAIVRLLIEKGADVMVKDSQGRS